MNGIPLNLKPPKRVIRPSDAICLKKKSKTEGRDGRFAYLGDCGLNPTQPREAQMAMPLIRCFDEKQEKLKF